MEKDQIVLQGWIEVLHRTSKSIPRCCRDLRREDYAPAAPTPLPLNEYDLMTQILAQFLSPQMVPAEGMELRGLREYDVIANYITTPPLRSSTLILVSPKNAGKFYTAGMDVYGSSHTELKMIPLPAALRFAPFFRNQ
jgi:hypothetical protein